MRTRFGKIRKVNCHAFAEMLLRSCGLLENEAASLNDFVSRATDGIEFDSGLLKCPKKNTDPRGRDQFCFSQLPAPMAI